MNKLVSSWVKLPIIIILLLVNHICISQNDVNIVKQECIYPVNDKMPLYLGGCDSLVNYFRKHFNFDKLEAYKHLPKVTSYVTCKLDSTGFPIDIDITSKNPIYNKGLVESIQNMDKWDVSRLNSNEYYSLTLIFKFEYEFYLNVLFHWEIKSNNLISD
jgi:hypothetical protein